jgi:hypothetical protein
MYDPTIHRRRTLRLKDYDYSTGAFYFTLCTHNRKCVFGDVSQGQVILSRIGSVVLDEWERTRQVRPEAELDACVIMPNHFHGIVFIHGTEAGSPHSRTLSPPARGSRAGTNGALSGAEPPPQRLARSFGAFLGGFKSAITSRVNTLLDMRGRPLWQRNCYEHVIRNDRDLQARRDYIAFNPARWEEDEYYPGP